MFIALVSDVLKDLKSFLYLIAACTMSHLQHYGIKVAGIDQILSG